MTNTATEHRVISAGDSLAGLVLDYHQRAHTSEFISTCSEEMCRVAQQVAEWDSLLGVDA